MTEVVAAVVLAAGVLTGVHQLGDHRAASSGPAGSDSPGPSGTAAPSSPPVPLSQWTWHRLPDAPLSPRWDSVVAWTGSRVLVLGGQQPGSTRVEVDPDLNLRDGALYDPTTGDWHSIAPAPRAVHGEGTSQAAMVGDVLYLAAEDEIYGYDLADDTWTTLPPAPERTAGPSIVATDVTGRPELALLDLDTPSPGAGQTNAVQLYDPQTRAWSQLPVGGLAPSLDDRTLVDTPRGLVDVGLVHDGDVTGAEIYDGRSWTPFDTTAFVGDGWHWTGRYVAPSCLITRAHADPPTGRPVAHELDPDSRRWQPLPLPPIETPTGLNGERTSALGSWSWCQGTVLDDAAADVRQIERPDDLRLAATQVTPEGILTVGGTRVTARDADGYPSYVVGSSAVWLFGPPADTLPSESPSTG